MQAALAKVPWPTLIGAVLNIVGEIVGRHVVEVAAVLMWGRVQRAVPRTFALAKKHTFKPVSTFSGYPP